MKRGPSLRIHHRSTRLKFVKTHLADSTNGTCKFRNENKLNLDGPNGSIRDFGGDSATIWPGLCVLGKTHILSHTQRNNGTYLQLRIER